MKTDVKEEPLTVGFLPDLGDELMGPNWSGHTFMIPVTEQDYRAWEERNEAHKAQLRAIDPGLLSKIQALIDSGKINAATLNEALAKLIRDAESCRAVQAGAAISQEAKS